MLCRPMRLFFVYFRLKMATKRIPNNRDLWGRLVDSWLLAEICVAQGRQVMPFADMGSVRWAWSGLLYELEKATGMDDTYSRLLSNHVPKNFLDSLNTLYLVGCIPHEVNSSRLRSLPRMWKDLLFSLDRYALVCEVLRGGMPNHERSRC